MSGLREKSFVLVVAGLAGLLLAYLVVPIVALVPQLSSGELSSTLGDGQAWKALGVSAVTATTAVVVAAVLGIPFGYLLARRQFRGKSLVRAAVFLPLVLPPVVGGLLLLLVVGPFSLVGRWLSAMEVGITNSWAGIVMAQMFVAAPFIVITAESAFRGVDARLEKAASTLGRPPGYVFRRVSLPLARTGLLAGFVLGWMRALGEFGATAVLAYHPRTLPVATWVALSGEGLRSSLPLAFLAVAVAVAALLLLQRMGKPPGWQKRPIEAGVRAGPAYPGRSDVARRAYWPARTPAQRPGGSGSDDVLQPVAIASGDPGPTYPRGNAAGPGIAAQGGLLEVDFRHRLGSFLLEVEFRAEREILVLFGPSGSGKTTLLRCIAGLSHPDSGSIGVDGGTLFSAADGRVEQDVPPYRRRVATVFQDYALFPHLTVLENVMFGARGDELEHALDVLAMTRLDGFEERYPHQLSGGQQQRVALARALMTRPRVLLLDEPFSALDSNVREKLQSDLLRLQSTLGLTVIHVTHDLSEALVLADRIAVMHEGRVVQLGPMEEVLRRPSNEPVARFMGTRNLLQGRVVARRPEGALVRTTHLALWTPAIPEETGDDVLVCIRPEEVEMRTAEEGDSQENLIPVRLWAEQERGSVRRLVLRPGPGGVPGDEIVADVPIRSYRELRTGEATGEATGGTRPWAVRLPSEHIHVLPLERHVRAVGQVILPGAEDDVIDPEGWRVSWNEVSRG